MAITEEYKAYLESPKWKTKRLKVLHRDKFTCQKCRRNTATQVHHKTYKRIYKEWMRDLVSVCASCHREMHGIGKKKRERSVIGKVLAKVLG